VFPLPLPTNGPPEGFGWEGHSNTSGLSTTTAFNTGVDQRDTFLGQPRCIICGHVNRQALQHCHIIMQSEPDVWATLQKHNWIPRKAKAIPQHEPRDGLLMCSNHHLGFDGYSFFIRFIPNLRKFVFVNHSNDPSFQQFHGKAIALDIRDRYAPFPSLFIIHEVRVRAFHPFQPAAPDLPINPPWQDWMVSDSVLDSAPESRYFIRESPPAGDYSGASQFQPPVTEGGGASGGGGMALALNADVIADILAATHSMPSWKACEVEGTSWTGTAEENIQKYVSSIGVEDATPDFKQSSEDARDELGR